MRPFLIVIHALVGLVYCSLFNGFLTQLVTLTWHPVEATVWYHELRTTEKTISGKVHYRFKLNGNLVDSSDVISEKFSGDSRASKVVSRIQDFAPGSEHTVYVSRDGKRTSLGHFPREYETLGGVGLLFLLSALHNVFLWRKDLLDRRKQQACLPEASA